VPFYYIEYGIAQLGAIGLWMQFKKVRNKPLDHYIQALSLGGTKHFLNYMKQRIKILIFQQINIKEFDGLCRK